MEKESKPVSKRLVSLDALRGFDMFWIMGGETIFIGLAAATSWPFFNWCAEQLEHVPWHGFHFYDMIFPLFLFISGISFPFSLAKRSASGETRSKIYKHVFYRGLILVLLGILYNNGVRFKLGELRYGSVLGRIGMAWMFAALIFMNTKLTWRIVWFWALIIGYWLLLALVPAPDGNGADVFSREGNFASYVDRILMPGKLYLGNHDPEGILSTVPAISTALLGMFTGEFLMSEYFKNKLYKKAFVILGAGIFFVIIGKLWNQVFPINKNLWTSSFVCYVGGLSLILFSVFYLIIDVWGLKKWTLFFVVIGMNPITIYLANRIINFRNAARFFFGGFAEILPETWGTFINGIGITIVGWVFLYFLYKKKIFLKI